jgi:hypothetical protein
MNEPTQAPRTAAGGMLAELALAVSRLASRAARKGAYVDAGRTCGTRPRRGRPLRPVV